MPKILSFENVGLSYHTLSGEVPALSDVTFSVNEGEFVSIVGPSGCGKSTLLNLAAGLQKPERGSIRLNGNASPAGTISIGYMLQKDHLFSWRTIYQNILLGLEIQNCLTPARIQRIDRLLREYGLMDFKNAKPSQLSGGMRQRAALIRTLALDPSLLLLDEPFSALDYQTRLKVSDDISGIIRKEKKTALLVTHDIAEAVSISDRVVILTSSPAKVQRIIPMPFNHWESTPMENRNAPDFKVYFNKIWKEMNPDE